MCHNIKLMFPPSLLITHKEIRAAGGSDLDPRKARCGEAGSVSCRNSNFGRRSAGESCSLTPKDKSKSSLLGTASKKFEVRTSAGQSLGTMMRTLDTASDLTAEEKVTPQSDATPASLTSTATVNAIPPACQEAHPGIMLVLCGAPGSGKSTFSANLIAANPIWERVNQDTVKGGRKGSRQNCLAATRRIIKEGRCAIIDRCNVEVSQRVDFLQLSSDLGVAAHAVVFGMTTEKCLSQAQGRKNHEGGLEGAGAKRVVLAMTGKLRKEGYPSGSEGLQSIIVCSNHKDIAHALEVWKHPPVCPHDPESAFRSRGGGRGKLESFFVAPKARTSEAMITNETTQPADPSTAPKQGTGNLEPPSVGPQGPARLESGRSVMSPRLVQGVSLAGSGAGLPGSSQAALVGTQIESSFGTLKRKRSPALSTGGNGLIEGEQLTLPPTAPSEDVSSFLPPKNAFAAMMASAKSPKVIKKDPGSAGSGAGESRQWGGFAQDLRNVAMNPERERSNHPGLVVEDDYCIINDKFPKARLHGLVIARDLTLEGPEDLRPIHLPLLQTMQDAAQSWVESRGQSMQNCKMGFHIIPSMRQLHLHVISQDFDSPGLKHKKHWNSFVTKFFLELPTARRSLEEFGRVVVDEVEMKELLASQLRCHRCSIICKTMPALKNHIASCTTR